MSLPVSLLRFQPLDDLYPKDFVLFFCSKYLFKLNKVFVVIKMEFSFTDPNDARMKTKDNIPDFWNFSMKKEISFIPMDNLDSLIFFIAIIILCLTVGDHGEY